MKGTVKHSITMANDHFDRLGERVSTPWAFDISLWEDEISPGSVGKVTMPSGVKDGGMLYSFSPGNVNSKTANYGPPHMKIAFAVNGEAPTPNDIKIIFQDSGTHYAYPKALVSYMSIHHVDKPVLIPDTANDGVALPTVLKAGSPFATMGTSSLYNRESGWPEAFGDIWGADTTDDYKTFTAIFNVGQDTKKFENDDIFAAQVVVDMSHVGNGVPYGGNDPQFKSHNNGDQIWAILGEIAVRKFDKHGNPLPLGSTIPDTSYEVRVPADVPMHNRIIDEDGIVLTGEATWHAPRPGERKVNCGGCHAHSIEKTPEDFFQTLAATMPVTDFALETPVLDRDSTTNEIKFVAKKKKLQIIEFNEHVLPIINTNCVGCHQPGTENGIDLKQTTTYKVYDRLAYDEGFNTPDPLVTPTQVFPATRTHQVTRWVRKTSAAQSLLVWAVYGKRLDGQAFTSSNSDYLNYNPTTHPDAGLTFEQKRIFASWVDLGCLVNRQSNNSSVIPRMRARARGGGWSGEDQTSSMLR